MDGRSIGDRDAGVVEPTEPVELLLRDLRATRDGLSTREADRRLVAGGPNELVRREGPSWTRLVAVQLAHPLALLLWGAALLALATGATVLSLAIMAVILLNAAVAVLQERQAERAVEALASYMPARARVLRDGRHLTVDARALVPGDVLIIEEGDGISADARLLDGDIEVDMSALTGEALPALRTALAADAGVPLLEARELVFSGTSCTGGEAAAVVFATGMRTELGRIAALSQRVEREESPLETQVRRVAWIIAAVAVAIALAFVPLGILGAGLSPADAATFAIGLLVANVPEGLLPIITLALAVGVRALARRGALVKRLSAVETLGSTDVVCTDKTGTLTENRMRVTRMWTPAGAAAPGDAPPPGGPLAAMLEVAAACNHAELQDAVAGTGSGDPTEVALLAAAARAGVDTSPAARAAHRRAEHHFDAVRKMMSTVDERGGLLWVDAKGAPEEILARCTRIAGPAGGDAPLGAAERAEAARVVEDWAGQGLRVLGVARRPLAAGPPPSREDAEREMTLLGLVAMLDPPRAEVAPAVARCHEAGIRIIVVTGDHGATAAEVAREVGIARDGIRVVTGAELERMGEPELDELLRGGEEVIFARSSPEVKLRVADALRAEGHVVAMTGDGVNDAPALRRADIGVAMGRSGTDVAREASTMVLTDDDFATIVAAVEEGRRVFDDVRKFILYIFAHATPEVLPFLVYALSGGAVPLPLTVLQILAIDLGTDTLPALALGREPAEPGVMRRPPRSRHEGVIRPGLLLRAWVGLGLVSATLVMAGFLGVLVAAGWSPGDPTGPGTPLHHAYLQATTMTFLGIVACQIGAAMAARTERVSLRSVGLLTNRLLLWGIAFEVAFATALATVPPLQAVFGTALPDAEALLVLPLFPVVVWGVDETRRWLRRRQDPAASRAPARTGALAQQKALR